MPDPQQVGALDALGGPTAQLPMTPGQNSAPPLNPAPAPKEPGHWAKSILSALGNALTEAQVGGASVGKVAPGGGFLEGFNRGGAGVQAQQQAQQAQAAKEQDAQQKQQMEEDRLNATEQRDAVLNASANANMTRAMQMLHDSEQKQTIADLQKSADAIIPKDQILYDGVTADQAMKLIQDDPTLAHKARFIPDGEKPVLDGSGKPTGQMVTTYRVGLVPGEVTLSQQQADQMNKDPMRDHDYKAGDVMPGALANHLFAAGTKAEAQRAKINQMEKGVNDAFHEWLADPKDYTAFQSAMTKLRAAQGIGSKYASVRALDMAALYFPAGFRTALEGANRDMGWGLKPDQLDAINQNFMANVANYQGQPLGERSKLNPTAPTEGQAQMADKVLAELPRVNDEINKLAPKLGPINGRVLGGYLLGHVGSTGNADLDNALTQLKTDVTLLDSAGGRFHTGLMESITGLERAASVTKNPAPALLGFTAAIQHWAEEAQKEGKNVGGGATQLPSVTYNGKTYTPEQLQKLGYTFNAADKQWERNKSNAKR